MRDSINSNVLLSDPDGRLEHVKKWLFQRRIKLQFGLNFAETSIHAVRSNSTILSIQDEG